MGSFPRRFVPNVHIFLKVEQSKEAKLGLVLIPDKRETHAVLLCENIGNLQ